MLPLHDWENFYVIVGSSAAALTGLQFVVIALSAEAHAVGGEEEVATFATPTIVHFCAVLTIAAIVSIPGQSGGSLSVCFMLEGIAGVIYAIAIALRARRTTGYVPVFEDWVWHAGLPICAYAALFVSGIFAYVHPAGSLYWIAATALLLLFTGIHNAWDAAVFISTRRRRTD